MTKTEWFKKLGLEFSGTMRSSWGGEACDGRVLLLCWLEGFKHVNDKKVYGHIQVLSPCDRTAKAAGARARARIIDARLGKPASALRNVYVAISSGSYPDWMPQGRTDQVYPVIGLHVTANGDVYASVGKPNPTEEVLCVPA